MRTAFFFLNLVYAGSLSIRVRAEPETLDWNRAYTPAESMVLMSCMEGLVAGDGTLALADSLDAHDDFLRIKLKPGILWSDGRKLIAQHLVDGWRRLLAPMTASPYASLLFPIQGAREFHEGKGALDGLKVIDDLTLEVKLVEKVVMRSRFAFWPTFPVRLDLIDAYASEWVKPGRMPSLGPYMMTSWDEGSMITLHRNPHYHARKKMGSFDEIKLLVVKDDAEAVRMYQAGALDIVPDLASSYKKVAGFHSYPFYRLEYLGFTHTQYPLSRVELRRAIAGAIDRKKLAKKLGEGFEPAFSFVPVKLGGCRSCGVPYAPKPQPPVTLDYVMTDFTAPKIVFQSIREDLAKIGITLEAKPFEHTSFRRQLDLGTFPLFESSWAADYEHAESFLQLFASDSRNNKLFWSDPRYDAAVKSMAIQTAEKILLQEDVGIVPLVFTSQNILIKPDIRGVEISKLSVLRFAGGRR